jgi:hypothetical protein
LCNTLILGPVIPKNTGFLHRAADLTLVPSAAISKDFETAQVISGWSTFVHIVPDVHMFLFML